MTETVDVYVRSPEDPSGRFVKIPRILYSSDGSSAARNASKSYFPIDSRTGLPVTPTKRGFFQVRKSAADPEAVIVEYRVGNRLFSTKKDSVIIALGSGPYGSMIADDILNSALFLMERDVFKTRIEKSIRGKNDTSDKREDWVGSYPKKNIHSVGWKR